MYHEYIYLVQSLFSICDNVFNRTKLELTKLIPDFMKDYSDAIEEASREGRKNHRRHV